MTSLPSLFIKHARKMDLRITKSTEISSTSNAAMVTTVTCLQVDSSFSALGLFFSTCFCICSCACVVNLGQISGFLSRRSDRPVIAFKTLFESISFQTSGTALSRMHESFRSHSSLQEHQ
ncbi:hypothetical protein L596_013227 [Steinernema carpocapsae]|uniref:Uncharacterized protein n=1 Tax=Steinernema carpocapsae TaxID=34508 RepID=A0A4U5NZI2_STECR|nr:hypothetical protein L596_013227 [Steinernema carpocapsae]